MGGDRAMFDQQPIEAVGTTAAALAAYRATGDGLWLNACRASFAWFIGQNDVGLPVYDPATGGCHDALKVDRLNQNQGAESTLAYLSARFLIEEIERTQPSIRPSTQGAKKRSHILGSVQVQGTVAGWRSTSGSPAIKP